jgi:hypothetical protein
VRANAVDYLFGLAKNDRLIGEIAGELAAAAEDSQHSAKPARRFKDFSYQTRSSWSCQRRVIGKAEWMTPSLAESDDTTQRNKAKAAAIDPAQPAGRSCPVAWCN